MSKSEIINRSTKMLNDCMEQGLAYSDSVTLSGKFVDDQIEIITNLINTSPEEKFFLMYELDKLTGIRNYLLSKL